MRASPDQQGIMVSNDKTRGKLERSRMGLNWSDQPSQAVLTITIKLLKVGGLDERKKQPPDFHRRCAWSL